MNDTSQKTIINLPKNNIIELKKPSELCQVLFFSDFTKKEYAHLTSLQIDLASTLFYLISDVINTHNLSDEDIFQWSSLNHIEINLQTISNLLGKYSNGYYEPIVSNLHELSKIQVLTNTLHKNKEQEQILFHLIRKISWVKDKHTSNKKVKVWIEPELLMMFRNVNKMYTSFYLQIQYGLNSKYSKLLYEILKDYANLGEITLDFDVLKALLNVDVDEKPDWGKWSTFNRDILKRAVHEVSEKSDITVCYEVIKAREIKKLEVTKVKFFIKKQKSILIDYDSMHNKIETDTCVVSDVHVKDKELSAVELKFYELAMRRMEHTKLLGTVVRNEKNYIAAIIEKMKSDNVDVVSMVELDTIISNIKSNIQNEKSDKNQLLVLHNYDAKYPIVSISNEYLLYSPVDKVNITKTASETINNINTFINAGGIFKLITTPGYVTDLSISYI